MELRPDITVAAAKLTSGFDVSRELRQLGAHLRDGEIVHRLAAGVYGSGGGLLAVTNRRVLLLRDGRGGQASEGFPLELLTSVEWLAGPARGTIIVSDADNTAELTQVEPVEGTSVVKMIRSLIPREAYANDEYEDDYDEPADAGEDEDALLTHGVRALSGAGRASSQAARTGRFAVTMKLRQPRDAPRGTPTRSAPEGIVPEQKTASERSMPGRSVRRVAAEADRPDPGPPQRRSSSSGSFPVGAVPVRAIDGGSSVDLSRSASFPEQSAESTGGSRRSRATSVSGGHSAVPGVRSVEGSGALGSKLVGEVPVKKLAEETGGQGAVSGFEDERPSRFEEDRADRFDDVPSRFDDDVPGRSDDRLPGRSDDRRSGRSDDRRSGRSDDRRSGRSDDPRGSRFDDDRDDRFDDRRPSRSEERRGGRSDDRRRTRYDESSGEFRRTRTAIDTGPFGATGPQRRRGDSRSRIGEDDHESPRRRKWLWIGGVAAAVAALGAVGGVALLQHSDSPAAVNPATAASDSLSGPVVKVTKVIDGDTIEVSGPGAGQVEVIGISAPRFDKGQCGASASNAFANRTLAGTNVTLITDPSQPATDSAGRRLASLRTDNGFDYAVLAAGAGMVRYYDGGTPVAQARDIKNAQAEAVKAERGLWGEPCNSKPTASGSGTSSSSAKTASTTSKSSASSSSKPAGDGPGSTSGSSR